GPFRGSWLAGDRYKELPPSQKGHARMPWPADRAAARRDAMLRGTRRVSVWIAGGPAGEPLGMGTRFGHAHPGPGAPATSRTSASSTSRQAGSAGQGGSAGQAGNTVGSQSGQGSQSSQLQQPQQPPAPSPAPPQAVSGGS